MRADLHTHSTASDGTTTPSELVAAAAAAGIDVLAITDHDTTAGWEEALAAGDRYGIRIIPGSEITTRVGRNKVHLLSYLQRRDDEELAARLADSRSSRVVRARSMVELLARDYPITWDVVLRHTPPGATIGRPHIADALVELGVAPNRDEVFTTVLYDGGRYDVPNAVPTPVEMVGLVRAAGGVPVIAHPRARVGQLTEQQIADLVDAGLAGIEVDHRDHSEADRRRLRELASELGIFVTGSSDYHGAGKLNELGENLTAPEVVEQILDLAGHR